MEHFATAQWIWTNVEPTKNEYGEFYGEFDSVLRKTICRIACDGDYTLFLNGKYVASNQYGDFEHYKIYDELDLTPYLQKGRNRLAILVWHFGADSQRYVAAKAGLLFEVVTDSEMPLQSNSSVLSRKSKAYANGYDKLVDYQLGFSFLYDATKEDGWQTGELDGFAPSVLVDKTCQLFPRPTEKLAVLPRKTAYVLKDEGAYYLIDLGEETVGLPTLEFFSDTEQELLIAWGEDLQGGHVRRIIGHRDFSFEYVAKVGKNAYTNYMLRLGCRYIEVYAENPIRLDYIGLLPQGYPVQETPIRLSETLDRRIYDVCVKTLRLSMMEHYVDTPWREQCLYAFDSRNQMLCGYSAFEKGNATYARANLKLISEDRREDGLLSICYPCGMDLTIPSFSLYYFIAIEEYLVATGDLSLAEEVLPKLSSILQTFISNRRDGLVYSFEGGEHWNFYDWSPHLEGVLLGTADGNPHGGEESMADLMLNALFIRALKSLRNIVKRLGQTFDYQDLLNESERRVKETFFHADNGLFSLTQNGAEYTVLGNATAILAGLTTTVERAKICEKLAQGELIECSLSMKCFKYDALLLDDAEKWETRILEEIRADYGKMLETGATSVWETLDGAAAFDNAGSLCHGWSAIPVHYYRYFETRKEGVNNEKRI